MEKEDENDLAVIDLGKARSSPGDSSSNGSFCLVGRMCTDKSINPFALIDVMKKSRRLDAREWSNNLFLFRFNSKFDMDMVLLNQPWHFEGHLFAIHQLKPLEQPSKIRIIEAPFWLRVYDAPVGCMNEHTATVIANSIGKLVCLDSSIDFFGKYI